jgi:hypothetical protein
MALCSPTIFDYVYTPLIGYTPDAKNPNNGFKSPRNLFILWFLYLFSSPTENLPQTSTTPSTNVYYTPTNYTPLFSTPFLSSTTPSNSLITIRSPVFKISHFEGDHVHWKIVERFLPRIMMTVPSRILRLWWPHNSLKPFPSFTVPIVTFPYFSTANIYLVRLI